jgi:outer membrane protein assembly factor BamD (BamD/ComL family)
MSEAQREFDAWEAAGKTNTRASYERFVSQFPDGRYTPQARTKLAGMAAAPAPAAVATPAPAPAAAANNPQAEFEVWDRASTSNRKADYEDYLRLYPNGRYLELARAALKKL